MQLEMSAGNVICTESGAGFASADVRFQIGSYFKSAISNLQSEIAERFGLVRSLVIAGLAARLTIHQPIIANANVHHRLAQAAELFALAG
jgi:hypothetical protein